MNTTLVVISDLHLDAETLGVPRVGEVTLALKQAVNHAIKIEADALVCLGDICDPDSRGGTMSAIQTVITEALRAHECGVPSIWIAGNHDVEEDGSGTTTLSPMIPLRLITNERVQVVDFPQIIHVGDVSIICLPFTASSSAYDPAHFVREAFKRDSKRRVVAGHLHVPGIIPGEETTDMPRGREVLFPIEETTGALFRMNGHFHTRQDFDPRDGGPPIHVPGAPAVFTFGEQHNQPSFSVVRL